MCVCEQRVDEERALLVEGSLDTEKVVEQRALCVESCVDAFRSGAYSSGGVSFGSG